jgi:hypothetical protein
MIENCYPTKQNVWNILKKWKYFNRLQRNTFDLQVQSCSQSRILNIRPRVGMFKIKLFNNGFSKKVRARMFISCLRSNLIFYWEKKVQVWISRLNFDLCRSAQGWISYNNICPTPEICSLRPSFLYKFTLIWHHAFAPCAQLIFSQIWVRSTLYAIHPTFMKSTPGLDLQNLIIQNDKCQHLHCYDQILWILWAKYILCAKNKKLDYINTGKNL